MAEAHISPEASLSVHESDGVASLFAKIKDTRRESGARVAFGPELPLMRAPLMLLLACFNPSTNER